MSREVLSYEDAAETVTVTGWSCKTCKRFWGIDEHMARYCCAKDMACECGKRQSKHRARCDECQNVRDIASYAKKTREPWDGESPLYSEQAEEFFFHGPDSVIEFVMDKEECEESEVTAEMVAALRLVHCQQVKPRHFEIEDMFEDSLGEDQELDRDHEIVALEKAVNAWIDAQPTGWEPTGIAVDPSTLPLPRPVS